MKAVKSLPEECWFPLYCTTRTEKKVEKTGGQCDPKNLLQAGATTEGSKLQCVHGDG